MQYNGSDCGVFTCMVSHSFYVSSACVIFCFQYARHLARNKLFNFSQVREKKERQRERERERNLIVFFLG